MEKNVSSPPSGLGTRLGTRLDKTLSHQQNWSFSRRPVARTAQGMQDAQIERDVISGVSFGENGTVSTLERRSAYVLRYALLCDITVTVVYMCEKKNGRFLRGDLG